MSITNSVVAIYDTHEQAERAIGKAYHDAGLIQGPRVTVNWIAPAKGMPPGDTLG